MEKKKNKEEYVDDGHTIYNMDVDGFKWHDRKKKDNSINVTRKERGAMYRAALRTYAPQFLIIIIAFTLTFVLLYFWLN